MLHSIIISACWILATCPFTLSSDTGNGCERLKESLTYTQNEAPRDLSSVFPVVVEKINRVLDGVVDVEVEWSGAELHGRVGEHMIECTVTRLLKDNKNAGSNERDSTKGENNEDNNSNDNDNERVVVRVDESGRNVTSQCFHIPFTILDTDECTLPSDHEMRHVCSPPSECVNTNGSYECTCPRFITSDGDDGDLRGAWELSFSSSVKTSCPSSPSTAGCCPVRAHSAEGKRCRERFHCPTDPCKENHVCSASAKCVRNESPNDISGKKSYSCRCPEGLMGNGKACRPGIDSPPHPKVEFDGVTPTPLTLKNNYYCGCTKPEVDACSGFPACKGKHEICTVSALTNNSPICDCKPGYVRHDKYECVDVNPPELVLRNDTHGDRILRLKQGQEYREYMVDITDENAEDYLRSLKITYSQPLPTGCLLKKERFHVNYTVAMPWANPPDVTVTRHVIVEDIDECSILMSGETLKQYQNACPQLVPQCDTEAGAECRNLDGSYTCQCPVQTTGDGFLKSAKFDDSAYPVPSSYLGGTSCIDTSKPVITIQGPNPKVFRVSQCSRLNGFMSLHSRNNQKDDEKEKLIFKQRGLYETDIKEMIRATAGAELCASNEKPSVNPRDCVKAIDRTYKGDVDLSSRVRVGDPVQKSRLKWVVPYDVEDDTGNKATTVYRDVVVEEVSLVGIEKEIREEVINAEKRITKRDIDNAIREERKKWEIEIKSRRNTPQSNTIKVCPACDCPDTNVVNANTCSAYCSNDVSKNCRLQLSDESYVFILFFWLEDTFPAELPPVLITAFIFFLSVYVLKRIVALLFYPKAYTNYDYKNHGSIKDEMVLAMHPDLSQRVSTQLTTDTSNGTPSGILPAVPTSTTSNYVQSESNDGAFFSPGNQLRSPSPPKNNLLINSNHESRNNLATPASIHERPDPNSAYQSPPLITPSKNGEGARRRSPYH